MRYISISKKSIIRTSILTTISFILSVFTTAATAGVQLDPIGRYTTDVYADGAAEIVSYDPASKRLFVVNANSKTVDVIDISNPENPIPRPSFDVTPFGKQANSVAVKSGVVAAAVEAVDKQASGRVVFFDAATGAYINDLEVGALPDMVIFTPDGSHVLVANEGEPNDAYTVDPEGSISIIDLTNTTAEFATQADVRTAGFTRYNYRDIDPSININGPGATVAQDLEPEYITVYNHDNGDDDDDYRRHSDNNWRAAVTLQENNAIAIIDVASARVVDLFGLGFKDYSLAKNALDASNEDKAIRIKSWPVYGMYQPDSIASYESDDRVYLVTANEGDAREYIPGFIDEIRVGDADVILDADEFPDAATLQLEENLGRLKIIKSRGDYDNDGDYDELYSFGARSFSIWSPRGRLVYDSASDVAHITASHLPANFNSDDEENSSFDDRSDDKGAEPEGIAIGEINGRTYGFIGLERVGGIMVYDITNPREPFFIQYVNTRDFSETAGELAQDGSLLGGDMSPEGLVFISAEDSPNGEPLLVVSFEVSGSTRIFQIND